MNRLSFYCVFMLCLFGLSLTSCGNEDMEFEPVKFDCPGLTLTKGNNVCTFHGTIPSSKTELTFVAIGENAEAGFLSDFSTGSGGYDFGKNINDYDEPEPKVVASGDWGYIEFVSSEPYTTKVVIFDNPSSTP